jgi:hypothetical protein
MKRRADVVVIFPSGHGILTEAIWNHAETTGQKRQATLMERTNGA